MKSYTEKATKPPIKNEATNGLKNDRGTIAMARTGVVDSATSQFFINTVDNYPLNSNFILSSICSTGATICKSFVLISGSKK